MIKLKNTFNCLKNITILNYMKSHEKYKYVLFLNINNFKFFNYKYGRVFSDLILINIKIKIEEIVGKDALVLRVFSDNYLIFFNKKTFKIDSIVNNFKIHDKNINFRYIKKDIKDINIGEVPYDSIINYTEILMNSSSLFYNLPDNISYTDFFTMENKIKDSLINKDRYELVLFKQGIFSFETKEINKYEILVRLYDKKEDTYISPFNFLDIAKVSGLYHKLSLFVVTEAFNYAKKVDYDISINLDKLDFSNLEQLNKIKNLIKTYEKDNIIFEILENEIFSENEISNLRSFISFCKENNIKIAIDDFGSGYSNFDFITKIKPDFIKIDGSLILNYKENLVFIKSIVSYAKEHNLKTVAEFVSSELIFNIMKNLGIDYVQGYYLSEPTKT